MYPEVNAGRGQNGSTWDEDVGEGCCIKVKKGVYSRKKKIYRQCKMVRRNSERQSQEDPGGARLYPYL
jgi:hypothetical protein